MYTINFPIYDDVNTFRQTDRIDVEVTNKDVVTVMFYAERPDPTLDGYVWISANHKPVPELPIRDAMILSLRKWCFIIQTLQGMAEFAFINDGTSTTCALCQKYTNATCYGCPVSNFTGRSSCNGTSWKSVRDADNRIDALKGAIKMYMFLMDLFMSYEDGRLEDGEHYLEDEAFYFGDPEMFEEDMCDCPICMGEEDDFFVF